MKKFGGFPPGKVRMTEVPAPFFSDLLPLLDDLAELKVTLVSIWALHQKEGDFRYLRREDFLGDEALMRGLAAITPDAPPEAILDAALAQVVERGTLLAADVALDSGMTRLYFMNTPRGQEAIRQLQKPGGWRPGDGSNIVEILPERPTIYRLYEENIGPLTVHISDELKDAEQEFSTAWVEEAIKLAVEANKRSWRYIRAILERWRKEGRRGDLSEGDNLQDGKRYTTGKFSDFIKR